MKPSENFNLANLSDDQLDCLLFDAKNELARRDTEKKKKYWAKVCEAITEYVENVGEIDIYDFENEAHLDPIDTFDFSEVGVIKTLCFE